MNSVVLSGKYDKSVDFDEMGRELSRDSGCKVWVERHGDSIDIVTDGNPERVMDAMLDSVADVIAWRLAKAVVLGALLEAIEEESKIRLN